MPITPQDFVSKWKRVTAREKQTYQEHFLDICQLVSHQTPNDFDPTGKRFAFEMGATKTTGGQGWADVAKLGFFGLEYKGKDDDLDKAYKQLLLYRESLENPPLLIVSDINNIIIRTNYTNLPTRTITLTLDDLLKSESIQILKTVFFNPEQLKPQITIEGVTQEAAKQFSTLANVLRKFGEEPSKWRTSLFACCSACLQKILAYCLKSFSQDCCHKHAAIQKTLQRYYSNCFAP